MVEQAIDFRDESEALYRLVADLDEDKFAQPTQFKGWTINNVMGHLHMWNYAADLSLQGGDVFAEFYRGISDFAQQGKRLGDFETQWLDGLKGRALVEAWRDYYLKMSARFEEADPKLRVKWAGPDMSVRSSITARLMETWAHGQEVYDQLGVVRDNKDRIKNIAVLGINTYGWTFHVRGAAPPEPKPHVRLTAPSGEIWTWNDVRDDERVEGKAEDFCQVVTQVRNIQDVDLKVVGSVATRWMSIAQCFAGPPETPPAPGSRHTRI